MHLRRTAGSVLNWSVDLAQNADARNRPQRCGQPSGVSSLWDPHGTPAPTSPLIMLPGPRGTVAGKTIPAVIGPNPNAISIVFAGLAVRCCAIVTRMGSWNQPGNTEHRPAVHPVGWHRRRGNRSQRQTAGSPTATPNARQPSASRDPATRLHSSNLSNRGSPTVIARQAWQCRSDARFSCHP
jgi:hypothetical protein